MPRKRQPKNNKKRVVGQRQTKENESPCTLQNSVPETSPARGTDTNPVKSAIVRCHEESFDSIQSSIGTIVGDEECPSSTGKQDQSLTQRFGLNLSTPITADSNLTPFVRNEDAPFALFIKLPAELQDMIWEAAVLGAEQHILEVMHLKGHDYLITKVVNLNPPLWDTCKNSRAIANLYSNWSYIDDGIGFKPAPFNPHDDIMYLTCGFNDLNWFRQYNDAFCLPSPIDLSKEVRKLAIDSRIFDNWRNVYIWGLEAGFYKELRELTIVVHHPEHERIGFECEEKWFRHGKLTFVGSANYALVNHWTILVKKVFGKSTPEIMVKLCMRNGKLCCDGESFIAT